MLRQACLLLSAVAALSASAEETGLATGPTCDFYVGLQGNDQEEGTEQEYPKATLTCAMDSNCNNGLQKGSVICMLPGEYEVYDRMRPGCKFEITVRATETHGVIFNAMGQTSIMGVGRTPMNFEGIIFTGGQGTTGAAVYGEAPMSFKNCIFEDNEAKVDAAAVMVMRTATFEGCQFNNNRAKYAGAVRVSDIGSASFKQCTFRGNIAEKKGGALVTQVEKKQNRIIIEDTLFCFNEAPEGKHIFNFRDNGHECAGEIGCAFNTKACCSDRGRVVADTREEKPEGSPSQVCKCDDGYSGTACEAGAALEGKDEL